MAPPRRTTTRSSTRRPAAKPEKSVREDLGGVIAEVFDRRFLEGLADSVKKMTKGYRGQGRCPECGSMKSVMVELPDLQGQLKAVVDLLEQSEGRPGTASEDAAGTTIIVNRPPRG